MGETWVRRPHGPTRLVLDVTRRCNLRCSMCRTWEHPRRDELSADEIGDIMAQLPGLYWLDVTGGEPFLRKDVAQIFDQILRNAPALNVLHFPTNGWFGDRIVATVREIVERRPEIQLIVTVSIDGPEQVHDRIRGIPGSFSRALQTFGRLREMDGVDVYVGTTVQSDNSDALEELGVVLKAEFPDFAATEWHWNRLQISGHFFNNEQEAGRQPERSGAVGEHIRRRGLPRGLVDLMELVFLVNLEFVQRGEQAGMDCQALRSTAFVSPEGELFPCHVYDRPLGSLREHTFAELWASRAVADAREDIQALRCGGCFTPCEAYPMLAGAPVRAGYQTARRSLKLLAERAIT